MFAIVEIAGLQYKVEQDQKLFVNRLKGNVGDKLSFDKVLMTVNGAITVGAPAINDVLVDVQILDHVKADKVIVFKKKRRKGYTTKNGHRQSLTQIQVVGITGFEGNGKKKASKKAAPAKETTSKTEERKSDHETVNLSEDHELNYQLKKHNLSQSKANREILVTLAKDVKAAEDKNVLTHDEVGALISSNLDKFSELKK